MAEIKKNKKINENPKINIKQYFRFVGIWNLPVCNNNKICENSLYAGVKLDLFDI